MTSTSTFSFSSRSPRETRSKKTSHCCLSSWRSTAHDLLPSPREAGVGPEVGQGQRGGSAPGAEGVEQRLGHLLHRQGAVDDLDALVLPAVGDGPAVVAVDALLQGQGVVQLLPTAGGQ